VKRTLALLGATALVAWTGIGLLAWMRVGQHVQVTFSEGEEHAQEDPELLALEDRIGTLDGDVRALAAALGENFEALATGIEAAQTERLERLESEVAHLRQELERRTAQEADPALARELAALRLRLEALDRAETGPGSGAEAVDSVLLTPVEVTALEIEPAPEQAPPEPAPGPKGAEVPAAPAAAKRSFLAFRLPSDAFRFDERRTWSVLPALSRVGFDGKSTLHDFSGTTSRVEGEIEADPSRPGDSPEGRIRVQAAALDTGSSGRDEEMREHLAAKDHPELVFELTGFEAPEVDLAAMKTSGRVRGRMTIRGVTRELSMPVRISVDEARRLCVEGEAPLDLEDYDVPVPSKLGVISMEKDVRIWISLKLRASAPAGSPAASAPTEKQP